MKLCVILCAGDSIGADGGKSVGRVIGGSVDKGTAMEGASGSRDIGELVSRVVGKIVGVEAAFDIGDEQAMGK